MSGNFQGRSDAHILYSLYLGRLVLAPHLIYLSICSFLLFTDNTQLDAQIPAQVSFSEMQRHCQTALQSI